MILRSAALVAGLVCLAACGKSDNTTVTAEGDTVTPVVVADAVCRPTPNGRDTTACYMNLVAAEDDRLVGVETPSATKAELHASSTQGGVMSMAPMTDGAALSAGQPFNFTRGGDHIMLTGVKSPLAAGDTVELTLKFDKAPDLTVNAPVGEPTEANDGFPNG